MDRLIDDYEKALTEEFELREPANQARWELKGIEALMMSRLITADEELPQWKAKELLHFDIDRSQEYREATDRLREAEYNHGKANICLAVAVERLELTKARLHGGHHEMLDMQEVVFYQPPSDKAVD